MHHASNDRFRKRCGAAAARIGRLLWADSAVEQATNAGGRRGVTDDFLHGANLREPASVMMTILSPSSIASCRSCLMNTVVYFSLF